MLEFLLSIQSSACMDFMISLFSVVCMEFFLSTSDLAQMELLLPSRSCLSIGIFHIHSWFGLRGLCFLPISLGFLTLRPSTVSSKFQLIRSKSFGLGFPSFGFLIVSKVTCMYSFFLIVVWYCLGGFRLLFVSVALHTSGSCHLYTKLLVLGTIVGGIGCCTSGALVATR